MALGAIIGGCLSSVAFLPLVGLSKLDAVAGSFRLAACAGVRLAAGLACGNGSHRRLAGALRRLGGPVGWVRGRVGAAVRRIWGWGRAAGVAREEAAVGGEEEEEEVEVVAEDGAEAVLAVLAVQ